MDEKEAGWRQAWPWSLQKLVGTLALHPVFQHSLLWPISESSLFLPPWVSNSRQVGSSQGTARA